MIKFFRRIRKHLLSQNKLTKYLIYALGEVVLVVIGILIALQINNSNDLQKIRMKELHYLANLKTDLQVNMREMDRYLEIRTQCIEAAHTILEHFEGKPITDYDAFNNLGVNIYNWQKFYQNNNTFQELINSGNLAVITNDSIKNMLLDIESLYKKLKSEEDHYRFDTEVLIYEPLYRMMDLKPMVNNFEYHLSGGKEGKDITLTGEYFKSYLNNTMLKNGFVVTIVEFNTMNAQMREMKRMSQELITVIDTEMAH